MKREGALIVLLLFFIGIVSAADPSCSLTVSLVNQDPYPAVPGEYVKLVFQVGGVEDPDCGQVEFELLEKYPLIFDPNTSSKVSLNSGTFAKDYSSHLIVPYKVRVDSDALNGENPIEVKFSNKGQTTSFLSKEFNLSVEDARADFEIYVKDFDFATNKVTFEVLNIGESNVEAVTLEIAQDNSLTTQGAKTKIIGDLDSNEYTTAEFEVSPGADNISFNVYYTDTTGTRRTALESVKFDSNDFANIKENQKAPSKAPWIIAIIVIAAVVYFWYKRKNKKRN